MTTNKCPKCGAPLDMDGKYVKDYACGSILNKAGGFLQRDICKDRQIAQLQEKLDAWREYAKHLAMMVPKVYQVKSAGYQNLKDLGEIT